MPMPVAEYAEVSVRAAVVACRTCMGSGIANTGDLGDRKSISIETYLAMGVACACPLGAAFAVQQMEWLRQGELNGLESLFPHPGKKREKTATRIA